MNCPHNSYPNSLSVYLTHTYTRTKRLRRENWEDHHHRPTTDIDQHYMDEIWKPSKKEGSSTSHTKSLFARSSSIKSSSSKSPFARSSSSKSPLLRSFSQKGSSPKCSLPRSFSQKSSSNSISHKCSSLAKEQKARFYIMRRCVAMLVCWHKHGDSWFLFPSFFMRDGSLGFVRKLI